MPSLEGKTFNQRLQVLTVCTVNMSGNFVKGRLMQMHLHRSFSARIRRSATGACSSQERLLRVASISARASQRGSNRPSTSTISGGNPRSMQTLRTFLMLVSIASACDKKLASLWQSLMSSQSGALTVTLLSASEADVGAGLLIGMGTTIMVWFNASAKVTPAFLHSWPTQSAVFCAVCTNQSDAPQPEQSKWSPSNSSFPPSNRFRSAATSIVRERLEN